MRVSRSEMHVFVQFRPVCAVSEPFFGFSYRLSLLLRQGHFPVGSGPDRDPLKIPLNNHGNLQHESNRF
jgi:hypothetical protein